MMRIRTIKPEFFTDDELYDAEIASALPLRLAFAGLWCACDREGRFEWRPRQLGAVILPYDAIPFENVLDALVKYGFVIKYRVGNAWFGLVPTLTKHQIINNREMASGLPVLQLAEEVIDACPTRDPRVTHASCGKGREVKGKEGKGIESNDPLPSPETTLVISQTAAKDPPVDFVNSWNALGKPFSKIESWNAKRKTALRIRMSDAYFAENWKAAIDRMKSSKFCRGENNRSWIADVGFFLRPDTIAKIMEGKYDNRDISISTKPVSRSQAISNVGIAEVDSQSGLDAMGRLFQSRKDVENIAQDKLQSVISYASWKAIQASGGDAIRKSMIAHFPNNPKVKTLVELEIQNQTKDFIPT